LESPRRAAPDPVPDTDTYVQLDPHSGPLPSDSMVLYHSTPLLPDPAAQEPISVEITPEISPKQEKSKLAWQQPGYSSKDRDQGKDSPNNFSTPDSTPRTSEVSPLLTNKGAQPPRSAPKDESACPCCPSSCTIL